MKRERKKEMKEIEIMRDRENIIIWNVNKNRHKYLIPLSIYTYPPSLYLSKPLSFIDCVTLLSLYLYIYNHSSSLSLSHSFIHCVLFLYLYIYIYIITHTHTQSIYIYIKQSFILYSYLIHLNLYFLPFLL